MRRSDRQLGMGADITRRDFIHDLGLASLGLGLPAGALAELATGDPESAGKVYPPTRTGLRGSQPGSFEVAHALALEGKRFDDPEILEEEYDLVVVGGGLSGLATAFYYRKLFGGDSRILVLENHDDFGGHARRNEFHQGGRMRLAWGGVFNLEYESFSDTVNAFFAELGVAMERLLEHYDFHYGADGKLGPATWFDAETYGRNVLVPGFGLRQGDVAGVLENVDKVPLDRQSIESLKRFYLADTDVLAGKSPAERERYLRSISYVDFVRKHGGLTKEAAQLFVNTTQGYWAVGADGLSVAECLGAGLPVRHLLGEGRESLASSAGGVGGGAAMFPDGNASVARMLVRALVPGVADGDSMDDIVTARFDYSRLDRPQSNVRIRLDSTVVSVGERGDAVNVAYVRGNRVLGVRTRHCVLACYHSIIPYLCPQLPEAQKEALRYQVKRPLLLTNVLLRDSRAADKLGISGAYCPGRLHSATWLVKGVNVADYRHDWDDDGPVVMMFWGSVAPPVQGLDLKQQHRASRARLLSMQFEDFEREVRTVLDGMLGPGGFDVAQDILAITVNRWPHGYAYDYLDLWDPEWPPGQAPHEIARQRFGNIALANSDAGADAYTHTAIEEAWRAVNELKA